MRLVAVVALLIAPATCWRGSARHTRHRDLKDLLLQRAVQTQLAQFHEQCAPPDEVKAEWLYRFHGNERLRSTSASGQLHALDALAVGACDADEGGIADEPRWRRYLSAMLAASPDEYAGRRELFYKATNGVKLQRRGALVEPRALAFSLMHTREQLAAEWSHDARALLRGGADDARALEFINRVGAGSWRSDVPDVPNAFECADASADGCAERMAVPVFFPAQEAYASARQFASSPLSTPLRLHNYDLLRLLAMRTAIRDVARALRRAGIAGCRGPSDRGALFESAVLARRAAPILERAEHEHGHLFKGCVRLGHSEKFLSALLAEATKPSTELATRLVVLELARALLAARARTVERWLDGKGGLAHIASDHVELQRAQLEIDYAV